MDHALPQTAVPLPREGIAAFCRRWNITAFELFGSILRADFGPDSDVDVLVTFDPSAHPTLFTLSEMEEELEALFGRKVDLLTRQGVEQSRNPYRRRAILESARRIYA